MASAAATGLIGGNGSSSSAWFQLRNGQRKKNMVNRVMVCSASSSVMDPYKTLRIQQGASESEVKKAFRQLALQIIFKDFKSSNILLDEDWNAKLSDFGLARLGPSDGLSHVSTAILKGIMRLYKGVWMPTEEGFNEES